MQSQMHLTLNQWLIYNIAFTDSGWLSLKLRKKIHTFIGSCWQRMKTVIKKFQTPMKVLLSVKTLCTKTSSWSNTKCLGLMSCLLMPVTIILLSLAQWNRLAIPNFRKLKMYSGAPDASILIRLSQQDHYSHTTLFMRVMLLHDILVTWYSVNLSKDEVYRCWSGRRVARTEQMQRI